MHTFLAGTLEAEDGIGAVLQALDGAVVSRTEGKMRLDQILDRLLQDGDVAIQYRVKRDILGISPDLAEMRDMQARISQKRKVAEILSLPGEPAGGEGWIGTELHGVTGFDFGLEILLERGLETTYPALAAARDALIRRGDAYEDVPPGYSVLLAVDRAGRGGLRTLRAWLLALLGAQAEPIVLEEMESALEHFRGLAQVRSLDEVSTPYTGGREMYAGFRVYKQRARFPGGWHHRLLAETAGWRTDATMALLAKAFNNAVDHFPMPPLVLRKGSHYVGPGNIRWECLSWGDIRGLPELEFYFWLRHIAEIGKLKVVPEVPLFQTQVEQLRELMEDEDWVAAHRPHSAFKAHYGLEEDWRSRKRRENDVYFRLLITLHYCGVLDGQGVAGP